MMDGFCQQIAFQRDSIREIGQWQRRRDLTARGQEILEHVSEVVSIGRGVGQHSRRSVSIFCRHDWNPQR